MKSLLVASGENNDDVEIDLSDNESIMVAAGLLHNITLLIQKAVKKIQI